MTFIICLLCLAFERFLNITHLRNFNWLNTYCERLQLRLKGWPAYLSLFAIILPLVLLVWFIQWLLRGWGAGLPELIFGFVVLLYCLGPENLWHQVTVCIKTLAENNDLAKTISYSGNLMDPNTTHQNLRTFNHEFTAGIFSQANRRIFSVLFWFALLGPAGAVLYRLVELCSEPSVLSAENAKRCNAKAASIEGLLAWIPARLLAISFALMGHFLKASTCWLQGWNKGPKSNSEFITVCGTAAIDADESEWQGRDGNLQKQVLELIDRTLFVWLVVLALLALA